ncbi:hypothetical protein [Streptomyces olindensis]|uniref:hypothetical protein n=1 Tax=Streptomyces olindensis TaxID=358823 RepID=UPI0036627B45
MAAPQVRSLTSRARLSLIERPGGDRQDLVDRGLMPGGFPVAVSSAKAALTALGKSLSEGFGPPRASA